MTHQDYLAEVDLEIEAWRLERYEALKRGDEAKVLECELKIEALEFYRERIAA